MLATGHPQSGSRKRWLAVLTTRCPFIHSATHALVPPTFQLGHPSSIKPLQKGMSEISLLADSKVQ